MDGYWHMRSKIAADYFGYTGNDLDYGTEQANEKWFFMPTIHFEKVKKYGENQVIKKDREI